MENKSNSLGFQGYLGKYYQTIVAASLFVVTFFVLYIKVPASPISSDVMWYINVGLDEIRDPFILNRYFHVYLLRFFLQIAPSNLEGYRILWSLIISLIVLLTFTATLKISSSLIAGLISIGILFSIPGLDRIAGVALVDITASFMTVLIINVYIHFQRSKFNEEWKDISIGFLTFLTLKTKETAFIASIPVLMGLFLGEGVGSDWRTSKRRFWLFVIGFLMGGVLFFILNALILKDPFFGFRVRDIKIFLSTYVAGAIEDSKIADGQNWFNGFWFKDLLIPFTLYLMGGTLTSKKFSLKILWLTPILVTLFIVLSVNNAYGYAPRFLFPALPVVAIFGATSLKEIQLLEESKWKDSWSDLIYALSGVGISLGIKGVFTLYKWDWYFFTHSTFYPLLFSMLLVCFLFRSDRFARSLLMAVTVASLVPGVITNAKQIFIVQSNFHIFNSTIYPLAAFSSNFDSFRFDPEEKICVDSFVFKQPGMASIVKDVNEFISVFNFIFDTRMSRDNVRFINDQEDLAKQLYVSTCDFALTTSSNFMSMISETSRMSEWLVTNYEVHNEPRGQYILLALSH